MQNLTKEVLAPHSSTPLTTDLPLRISLRRVIALAAIAGYVEVIGFLDVGGIYPGIMTGNTVQLGLTFAKMQWARFGLIAFAVALFFIGGIFASLIRRHLKRPPIELLLMGALLCIASLARLHPAARVSIELPLLAFAMAMQGETISRFGGVSLQTIVVTNNMVKFSDAFVGRYMNGIFGNAAAAKARTPLVDVVLPGCAWLCYSIGAGAGATAAGFMHMPLLLPIAALILLVADLLKKGA